MRRNTITGRKNTMKKISITLIALSLFLAPYFVGLFQYHNVITVCQNFGNECNDDFGTDGEIENVLAVFNFDIDCMTEPTSFDFYKAGVKTIF